MYIRKTLIYLLIEAALDQPNPTKRLANALNSVLLDADHDAKKVTA